jgi:hypothetical protein
MSLADHIPSPAEIAARRARLGMITQPKPVFALVNKSEAKPEPKPVKQAEPEPVLAPEPRSPLAPSLPGECPTLAEIVRRVAWMHRIPVAEILSPDRHEALVKARDHIVWLSLRHTYKSLPQIGKALGRDHTTILHSMYKNVVARGTKCREHTRESVLANASRYRVKNFEYPGRDKAGRFKRVKPSPRIVVGRKADV